MWHHLSFTAISHQRFLSLRPAISEIWLSSSGYPGYPPGYPHLAQNKRQFIHSSLDTGPSHAQYLPLSLVPHFQTVLPILPWLEGYSYCSDDKERSSASFGFNRRGWYHLSTRLRVHRSFAAPQHCLRPHWITSPRSVVGQCPRAWWCAGTRSLVLLAVEAHSFGRNPLLGTEAAEVPDGDTLALFQHVHKAQGVLLFMGRWGTSKSNKATWKNAQHT